MSRTPDGWIRYCMRSEPDCVSVWRASDQSSHACSPMTEILHLSLYSSLKKCQLNFTAFIWSHFFLDTIESTSFVNPYKVDFKTAMKVSDNLAWMVCCWIGEGIKNENVVILGLFGIHSRQLQQTIGFNCYCKRHSVEKQSQIPRGRPVKKIILPHPLIFGWKKYTGILIGSIVPLICTVKIIIFALGSIELICWLVLDLSGSLPTLWSLMVVP